MSDNNDQNNINPYADHPAHKWVKERMEARRREYCEGIVDWTENAPTDEQLVPVVLAQLIEALTCTKHGGGQGTADLIMFDARGLIANRIAYGPAPAFFVQKLVGELFFLAMNRDRLYDLDSPELVEELRGVARMIAKNEVRANE